MLARLLGRAGWLVRHDLVQIGQHGRTRRGLLGVAENRLQNSRGDPVAVFRPFGMVAGRGVGIGEGDDIRQVVGSMGGRAGGCLHVVQRNGRLMLQLFGLQCVAEISTLLAWPAGPVPGRMETNRGREVVDDCPSKSAIESRANMILFSAPVGMISAFFNLRCTISPGPSLSNMFLTPWQDELFADDLCGQRKRLFSRQLFR